MSGWSDFLKDIEDRVNELRNSGCPDIYFRGHANKSWKLEPGLARERRYNGLFNEYTEERLYWSFRMRGAHLLPAHPNGWTVLFFMQHFGLPTRLLDWSTTFASALYFALADGHPQSPCIWMLDPYELNRCMTSKYSIKNISVSHDMDYSQFIKMDPKPLGALATDGDSAVERIRSQSGAFTLHSDLDTPLERLCPQALSKHILPKSAIASAKAYLQLAGVDDFSIFPDLAGLARRIRKQELGA